MSTPLRDQSDRDRVAIWRPGELWSLWDIMHNLRAAEFFRAYHGAVCFHQILAVMPGQGLAHFPAESFDGLKNNLSTLRDELHKLGMGSAKVCIERVLEVFATVRRGKLQAQQGPNSQFDGEEVVFLNVENRGMIQNLVQQATTRIADDFALQSVLIISGEFWDKDDDFGLGRKFEPAHRDIKSAGNCLAVGEGTACVLHLSRAMEVALKHLARRFKITIAPKDTWGTILGKMEAPIRALPEATQKQKTKKDKWSETRVHLRHVKDAWRDRTAHGKETFTPARAKEIYEAVRVFMRQLAVL
jgi:hypothetical protein